MLEKRSVRLSLILILIVMHFAVEIADSITIPSDKNIPDVPKDLKDFVYSGPSGESKSVIYSSGNGAKVKTQYIQVPENPIIITKSIIPLSENYHPGDLVAVFVEIKNLGTELKHINIKEFVDNGIEIINISKNAYIMKELDEIAGYKTESNNYYYLDIDNYTQECNNNIGAKDRLDIKTDCGEYLFNQNNIEDNYNDIAQFLNENFDINWSNITIDKSSDGKTIHIINGIDPSEEINITIDGKKEYGRLQFNNKIYKFKVDSENIYKISNNFDIYLDKLERKDRVAYWYYIKLKEIGDFDASTIFRYWVEENSHFLDVDKIVTINVVKPRINVDIDINRLNLLKKEDAANITYRITYIDRPISNILKLDFVKKSSYTEIERYGPDIYIYPKDIHIGEPFTKTIKISYPNEGEYYSPEIIIEGDIYPFTKEKILVETRFGKYADLVALIMAIALFFIGDSYGKLKDSTSYRDISNDSDQQIYRTLERSRKTKIMYLTTILIIFICLVPVIYFLTSISVLGLVLGSLITYILISVLIMLYFKKIDYLLNKLLNKINRGSI